MSTPSANVFDSSGSNPFSTSFASDSGALQGAEKQRDQTLNDYEQSLSAVPTPPAALTPPSMTPPRNQIGAVMKSAPWLIALAALGGAKSRISAINMLAATNGMVKGILQGNAANYQDAWNRWQTQWKAYSILQQQKYNVYKDMVNVYRNQIDGKQKALEVASAAVRDQRSIRQQDLMAWYQSIRASLALKNWQQKYAALNSKNQIDQEKLAEQTRHDQATEKAALAKIAASKTENQTLDARGEQILGFLKARDAKFPLGFGGKSTAQVINGLEQAFPKRTPRDIADMVFRNFLQTSGAEHGVSLLGKREAAVESSMRSLVAPGGLIDQAIQIAKKAGISNHKVENHLLITSQMVRNNPAMQQYINLIKDARAEYQQALARGGAGTDMQLKAADEAFPEYMTLDELMALKSRIPKITQSVLSGTQSAESSMIQGAGSFAPASASPSSSTSPPKISNYAQYEALAPGTVYIDPNGVTRTKGNSQ